jgi:hypothetical protein
LGLARLNNLPMWTAAAPLMPMDDAITLGLVVTSVLAFVFHLPRPSLAASRPSCPCLRHDPPS